MRKGNLGRNIIGFKVFVLFFWYGIGYIMSGLTTS